MAPEVRYLNVAEAIALHAYVMERMGLAPTPLRSQGGLESAVLRPQMAAHYEDADLIRQAALLAIGISQAQAFLHGNKRTAYMCCDVFLRANDRLYVGPPIDFAKQLEAVAERDDSLEEATGCFEDWLRGHVEPR